MICTHFLSSSVSSGLQSNSSRKASNRALLGAPLTQPGFKQKGGGALATESTLRKVTVLLPMNRNSTVSTPG
eukprot:CAMPEP_0177759796 /NCGR_PEP_ID=MMETSP0491_2-20121128/4921_1 /TAXON_ID=63592 /ORGANISM="Tetraselmis chuii, Strain PLY429" /LENGTH=71 /DNA_ID=CAMNT_0019275645 /DNA_START=295 /DNA_END=510 /DNA_ORIENTATION=-